MPRNFIRLLIFLTFIVSCSNLDNQNDQAQLICGETKDTFFAWLHIENAEAFDAILIKDGSAKTASKTQKSCIAIAEEDRDHQLFVRDSATKNSTLSLDLKNLAPGLSNFSLAQNNQNQKHNTQVRCPATQIFAADKLELFFKRSSVDFITYPMAEIKIFDPKENLRLHKTLTLGEVLPSLLLGLSDGQYRLEMRNFDAFTPETLAGASPEVCTLVIDSELPVTHLKAQSITPIGGNSSAFKVPPGAKLEFVTEQDPGVEVYVCLKERGNEKIQAEACNLRDFNNVGNNLNAPESGAWDLYAFSKDKAGNTSPLSHSTLYIYHDALIAEIRALSKTIQLLVEARKNFEAFKAFQKLLAASKKLALKMEIDDIYWHLFTHFEWTSNQNSVIWAQAIKPNPTSESVAVSAFADAWAFSTEGLNGGSYFYHNGVLTHIETSYHEFKYIDQTRMVGIRRGNGDETIVDLFENYQRLDSRTFTNFYEDIEIDQTRGVFVLVSLIDLTIIDMNSLEKKQIIPIPEDLRYTQHPGLEFSISPDNQYYYVSFAEYVFRIDWSSGITVTYKDPKGCWIRRPELTPTGELYYVNYSEPAKPKDCKDVYRIDWSQQQALASAVSNDGRDYDSIAIVDMDNRPYLVSSRKQYLDFKDLSGSVPDRTLYSKSSGYLKRHPMYRNVLYLEGERSLHLISLPLQKNTFLDTLEIPLPGNEANRPYFPTRDSSRVLMLNESEVQLHSFIPETLGIMEQVSSGEACAMAHGNDYSLCKRKDGSFHWADHQKTRNKVIIPPTEIKEWQILTDGEVILITAGRELLQWSPTTERFSKIADISLEGKLQVSWFPLPQVLAVHHAVEYYTFYPDSYRGSLPPQTLLFTRKGDQWISPSQPMEGFPLSRYSLPVVLLLGLSSQKANVQVVDQSASLINTLELCSVPNSEPSRDFIIALTSITQQVMASGLDPFLYSTCSGKLRKLNMYNGTEHETFPIPEGYVATTFDDDKWVYLESETSSKWIMNLRTGLYGDFLDENIWKLHTQVEWSHGISYFSVPAVVTPSGESFRIDLRRFFQTADPFTVGLTRKDREGKTNSIMKVNPHWMDRQLQKSPLYHLERREWDPRLQ